MLGFLKIEIYIPEARTLKDRRQVVKSIIDRIRHKYNVSIAELDEAKVHKRALLGISFISNKKIYTEKILATIEDLIHQWHRVEIINKEVIYYGIK